MIVGWLKYKVKFSGVLGVHPTEAAGFLQFESLKTAKNL